MKSLMFVVLGLLSAFYSSLIAEVVVDWELFRTGTPAEVETEIDK
jgi:hypothetical protein